MNLITRLLNSKLHYWNTCGWTQYLRNARRFTRQEAETVFQQMSDDGLLRIEIKHI